jgi:hypothetical protein
MKVGEWVRYTGVYNHHGRGKVSLHIEEGATGRIVAYATDGTPMVLFDELPGVLVSVDDSSLEISE